MSSWKVRGHVRGQRHTTASGQDLNLDLSRLWVLYFSSPPTTSSLMFLNHLYHKAISSLINPASKVPLFVSSQPYRWHNSRFSRWFFCRHFLVGGGRRDAICVHAHTHRVQLQTVSNKLDDLSLYFSCLEIGAAFVRLEGFHLGRKCSLHAHLHLWRGQPCCQTL